MTSYANGFCRLRALIQIKLPHLQKYGDGRSSLIQVNADEQKALNICPMNLGARRR